LATYDYDAIVIGSGFGGSVSSYRLAAADKRVCVLERGKAYPPGAFPRSPFDFSRAFWDPSEGQYGIYNVWSFDGVGALVSSGLGGGSLIYANVLLEKDADTFVSDKHEAWPIDYATLAPHYANVRKILKPQRYPFTFDPYSGTPKTIAMQAAGAGLPARLGIPGVAWGTPELGITFGNPGVPPRPGEQIDGAVTVHGTPHPQLTCLLTGECNLGCNYGSKNSLDLNYLALAKQAGAVMRPCHEAIWIAPVDDGYEVRYVDHSELVGKGTPRKGLREERLTSKVVVLSAGSLGSTFLLLKCRRAFPKIADGMLGSRFSANGDLLTLLVKARQNGSPRLIDPSYGPVITSAIRVPSDSGQRRGHYIEDAGYPYLASWLVQLGTLGLIRRLLFRFQLRRRLRKLTGRSVATDLGADFADLFADHALSSSSMPMLGMGRDFPTGQLFLTADGALGNDWNPDDSKEYFDELEATARGIAAELEGEFRDSRIRRLTKDVTVHPLGGCPMGEDAQSGVVDTWGELYGYPGFFVADGSVLPGPVGPNPSLTIAALTDRFAAQMIARC
jgi:cholesterol oxidase